MKSVYSFLWCAMFGLLLCLPNSLRANEITVTVSTDGVPGSLRNTVATANAGDTIVFSLVLSSVTNLLTEGEITVDKDLTIIGDAIVPTLISGNDNSRIFNIVGDVTVEMSNLILRRGAATANGGAVLITDAEVIMSSVTIAASNVTGAAVTHGGGAIANVGGSLTLTGCTLQNNNALGSPGSGGALINLAGGFVTATSTTFSGNTATRAGGAIEDNSGTEGFISLTNVTINNNETGNSPGNGGGLHITGPGDITITGGTVNNNNAGAEGGGLWNGAGVMTLTDVTINGNVAGGDDADQGGGGIYNLSGTVNLSGGVITNNTADGMAGSGGGILNDATATLSVENTTISGNVSNRAGGGIEDNSGAAGGVTLLNVALDGNTTNTSPGNGGGLHITGPGDITITGGTVNNNNAGAEGGGLWNGAGVMTVNNVTIDGNVASGDDADQGGGGIYNLSGTVNVSGGVITNNTADGMAGSGGGILNDATATLSVENTTISGNVSNRAGGGIEDNSGAAGGVTLLNVALDGNTTNTSPGNGGGLHITGPGDITITGGTVNNNNAGAEGGGLWNGAGVMTLTDVTIDGNVASGDDADQGGGGIYNLSGTVNVNGGVITNNTADGMAGSGGGILNDATATLSVENTTISGNVSNRAGGGIEDNSGAAGGVILLNVALDGNTTNTSPGNGGGLHITGPGDITITGGTVNNNNAGAEGGGLWNGAGVMTLTNVTIDGNVASGDEADQGGGGVFNFRGTVNVNGGIISNNQAVGNAGSGGGILNDTLSVLTVRGTEISGNLASRAGGGIEDNSRESTIVTLDSVTLVNNLTGSAPGNGGAVHITGAGDMNISASIITENIAAAEGGGLWNGSGTMTVSSSTIADNQADGTGEDQGGGGLFNNGGSLELFTSTVSGNRATSGGGGITNNGNLTVSFSTIVFNNSSASGGGIFQGSANNATALTGTIVALNTSNDSGSELAGEGDFTSGDHNVIESDEEEVFVQEGNDTVGDGEGNLGLNLDPALRDNGGATPTHAFNCPSIAEDGGPSADGSIDQRGEPVAGPNRDIGAFERQDACTVGVASLGELRGSNLAPNPTGGNQVRVNIPMGYGQVTLRLVEASTGRVALNRTVFAGQTPLNLSGTKPGLYIVELIAADAYVAHRMIVSR